MTVRLMVVEDTDHVRKMLLDILELHGFEIAGEAGSGEQAIERVRASDPDVVIVDYMMPEMDGLEVARRIREQRPDQQMILYSAYVDDELERGAQDAGIAVCVPKMAGVEELAREITAVAMDLGDGKR
ncbi:MAG: response regulator transcription factor [Actinobacteria bacterium]|nr:response regulator transcription factor [Actinomycetota bacterium]